jgi:predicted lipoprotein with Yx(FWY)xxD motif
MRRELMMAAAVPVCVLGLAACGGGGSGGGTASSAGGVYSQPQRSPAPAAAALKVSTTKLGRTLTDANGRTLYIFEKDKGTTSECSGACANIWPPLTAATGVAGPGLSASALGSVKRPDGTTETTYAGHPLYTYAGDAKPGDTRGQGLDQFGAEWYALAPDGKKIDGDEG